MAVPMGLLRACVRMLPRLHAEEQLAAADITRVGAGLLQPDAARQVYARLHAAAAGTERTRPRAATPAELQIFGIGIERRDRGR